MQIAHDGDRGRPSPRTLAAKTDDFAGFKFDLQAILGTSRLREKKLPSGGDSGATEAEIPVAVRLARATSFWP